jgi:phospholipase/carboxylesterase
MSQRLEEIAGLNSIVVDADVAHHTTVILLHGYAMTAADLAPFGSSLDIRARFVFPDGPRAAEPAGRAWWVPNLEMRRAAQKFGPRDLVNEQPVGISAARVQLGQFIAATHERFPQQRLVLGGFSQGGMLACDWLLHDGATVDALMLLSSSRINLANWMPRLERLRGLPVFISHGRADNDLAFSAGEGLRDMLLSAQANVSWVPFEGGHQIPLPVWRSARKFLRSVVS